MNEHQETLLEFPCDFPLKVMGIADDALSPTVVSIVQKHAPEFDASSMEIRSSSGGKYTSLTCTITVTSKPQLDALYRELSGHPMVKVVL